MTGIDEKGAPIDVRDPMAARLKEIAVRAEGSAENLARDLFTIREIFGDDLPSDPSFKGAVTAHLARLYEVGARRAVSEFKAG